MTQFVYTKETQPRRVRDINSTATTAMRIGELAKSGGNSASFICFSTL